MLRPDPHPTSRAWPRPPAYPSLGNMEIQLNLTINFSVHLKKITEPHHDKITYVNKMILLPDLRKASTASTMAAGCSGRLRRYLAASPAPAQMELIPRASLPPRARQGASCCLASLGASGNVVFGLVWLNCDSGSIKISDCLEQRSLDQGSLIFIFIFFFIFIC